MNRKILAIKQSHSNCWDYNCIGLDRLKI